MHSIHLCIHICYTTEGGVLITTSGGKQGLGEWRQSSQAPWQHRQRRAPCLRLQLKTCPVPATMTTRRRKIKSDVTLHEEAAPPRLVSMTGFNEKWNFDRVLSMQERKNYHVHLPQGGG
jgi:hypothetical protein